MTLLERLTLGLLAGFTVAWFFALGASFGSFLNVLVYRLPRRLTLTRKPSRCPSCGTPILARDNVPVFGWLWLRGRCRACGWSIPVRYPLVETLVGVQFLGLMLWEVASGGWNIPVREPHFSAGLPLAIVDALTSDLLLFYAYHLLWLFASTAIVLMAVDRQAPPLGFVLGVWGLLFVAPLIVPPLLPLLGPFDRSAAMTLGMRGQAAISGLIGCLVGGLAGVILSLVSRRVPGESVERVAVCMILMLTGTALGWQAAVSTALLASLLWMLRSLADRAARDASPAALAVETLVACHLQILGWRWLSTSTDWPGHRCGWAVIVMALFIVLGVAVMFPRAAPTTVLTRS